MSRTGGAAGEVADAATAQVDGALVESDWCTWTCVDVGLWLDRAGFSQHKEVFRVNEVAGDILPELSHEFLCDYFGIAAFGQRVRLLNAVKKLLATSTAGHDAPVADAPTAVEPTPAPAPPRRDANSLDLVVLHAAPLVMINRGRIFTMEKLDLEAERRAITNSLLANIQHKAIHVRFDIATADILRTLMTAWKCRVLHFSGHGMGQNTALCFEDGSGCTHMITPDLLRQLTFSGELHGDLSVGPSNTSQSVQLVFVNACHSQRVASVFISIGIPHVVAVHSDSLVVDATATMFAKHFYLSLFSGHTVKTAFEIAKGAVRALPMQRRAACCCAHLHEPNCPWMLGGLRHSAHSKDRCCCKGHVLAFPHDESSKFLLLGDGDGSVKPHEVVLFGDIPNGELLDHTPNCKASIPSMHGQFIGRNSETYLMVKSVLKNSVTACLGAPGIGKSSLVISAAHFVHSRRMFPDGVFYVDLEGQKISTFRYAIAQSMGIPAADTNDEVFAELGSKQVLLVLDKVEELLDEDESTTQELLGKLISMAPNTRLLLASRRIPHMPNVTSYSLSLPELPLRTAVDLLCLVAPGCSPDKAEQLAKICGCLPLAIRVVGRALANARMTVTPDQMIEYLAIDERRFETIKGLNQVGHKECVDRCIRSSFSHLDEPLQLAFMALGFFRGSFDIDAVDAILLSRENEERKDSGRTLTANGSSTYLPGYAYVKGKQRTNDDDTVSVKSLGSQLSNMDEFGYDNDGAMSNDSYDLLDLESVEEIMARKAKVPSAKIALGQLHQWSLVEFDSRARRYRMHNLVQLFAEDEASRMGETEYDETAPSSPTMKSSSSSIPLGKELLLTWKRRFVRYYCMIVATASHAYRFEGTLALFDKERANIESAMQLAHELTVQSIEQVRERKRCLLEESIDGQEVDENIFANDNGDFEAPKTMKKERSQQKSIGAIAVNDSSIVDALLYSNLVVRCRFIFRARVDPRRRIQVLSACLQLSRETRSLLCCCGNSENDPSGLLWDVDEAKYDRRLSILDQLPSFEEPQHTLPVVDGCTCVGIRELIALETLLLTDLGYASCDVSDWVAGEYHYLESLRLQRDVLGWSEHAQVAEVLNQLGICLSTRWGYLAYNVWLLQHAEKLLKGSLFMRRRVLGENHPEYATSLNNLANFYKNCAPLSSNTPRRKSQWASNRSSISTDGSEDGHDINDARSVDGNNRPRSSCSCSSAGSENAAACSPMEHMERESDRASGQPDIEGMYRLSLKIREATLGENHPQVAQSVNNLALFLSNKLETRKLTELQSETMHHEIEKLYARALCIRRSTLGNASFETAATLNNMGNFKRQSKDYQGAEENIKEALRITDSYFNDIHPRAARMYINLGRVYKEQERYDEAIASYRKAQDIRQTLFPDTRDVGYCIEQVGKCLRLQGKEEEGEVLLHQARQMKTLGLSLIGNNEGDTSGTKADPDGAGQHQFTRVNVRDVVDDAALRSRRFNFAGKLLGERGIHLKRIEAIACAQVRYFGPWPGSKRYEAEDKPISDEAYLQITSSSEQTLERAKEQCVEHLRAIKIQWENFTSHPPSSHHSRLDPRPHGHRGGHSHSPQHHPHRQAETSPHGSIRGARSPSPSARSAHGSSYNSPSTRGSGHLHRHNHRARGRGDGSSSSSHRMHHRQHAV